MMALLTPAEFLENTAFFGSLMANMMASAKK
jgi:hypothetical protein